MNEPRYAPPRHALSLLSRRLPASERDMILGDLIELYADRIDAGARFNRTWFWLQTLGFLVGFAARPRVRLAPIPHRRRHLMERLISTIRQTLRRLRFEWRYAGGVVLILAVGIGPAAAMLSVVQKVLLAPLPYAEPDRLAIARLTLGQIQNHPGLSRAEIADLRELTTVFDAVEGTSRRSEVSLGPDDTLVPLTSISVTPGMLPMLGVSPIRGRHFTEADAEADAMRVLLGHGAWQVHFDGADDIVGRTIRINGSQAEVLGVLPADFRLTIGRGIPEPMDVYSAMPLDENRSFWAFPTIVRLADGVTLAQANERVRVLTAGLTRDFPDVYTDADLTFALHPLLDDMVRETRPAMRAALAGVFLLLLIALANATALVVARLRTRDQDLAIRSAMGAGRRSLITEVLTESALLSAMGAAAGAVVAMAGIAFARSVIPHTVPRWDSVTVGWELVAFSCVFALLGLVAAGLLPVWRISRGAPFQALRGTTAQGGRAEGVTSRWLLVGTQIALTVVLAFGAVQLMRSAARLGNVDVGFDANVLAFRLPVDGNRFQGPERAAIYRRVRDQLAGLPNVDAVGATSHLPLSGAVAIDAFSADLTRPMPGDAAVANYHAVLPGYLGSLRMTFVAGRDITDTEYDAAEPVVVIDETLASMAFGEDDPIDRTLRLGWGIPDSRVVGVVAHARSIEVERSVRPQVYAPYSTFRFSPLHFTVRGQGDPRLLLSAVDTAVREVGPGRAMTNVQMLTENVTEAMSTRRSVTGLVTILAMSAGLLSAIGLYTVMAYVVHQRRRSTAIRSALGASRSQIVGHYLRTTAMVMAVALPAGLGLALGAAPFFSGLVYEVSPRDAGSILVAVVVAATAGLIGTLVPMRRAANTDPVMVLRGDG